MISAGGEKKISVSSKLKNSNTVITIMDTGLGLREDEFEDVFIPFVADPSGELYKKLETQLNPEDKFIVGSGSGLGLGIVKEILDNREGEINFKKPKGTWKTILEIIIP